MLYVCMKESMLDELTLKGRVPPMRIAGEYGIISYKKVNIQKLCKWEACRMQLLSGEKGGTDERRGIVDSTM